MLKNPQTVKRFSESVKLQVLSELNDGKYTKAEVIRLYDVNPSTLYGWINKYKRKDLLNKRIKIETMDELSRVKALEKEISQLKQLLIKKELDKLVVDSYLEVAAKRLGFKDVDELKKKLDIKP